MVKEACVENLKEALRAEQKGADRIELCARLEKDGLTPAPAVMKKVCAALKIPVMVMIRPREGNFVYSAEEMECMEQAIDEAKDAGAAGIVLGLLTPGNTIDEKNTRRLVTRAQPLPVTFHKAIDELKNPEEGVKVLKTIKGIHRILSSGGKPTASEGVETLRKMIKAGGGHPLLMVAGKVTDRNVEAIAQKTGAKEFHGRRIVGEL